MGEYLKERSRRSWEWFQGRATSIHAKVWLFALAFSESSFFLVPPDVLLIAMLAARAERWVYLAVLTTLGSLAGAVVGYALGAFVFEPIAQPIVSFYGLTDAFTRVGTLYDTSTFWVVLAAAFTPIPFKVFVLSGGFFKVPFLSFLLGSTLGRSGRFFLVAWLSHRFGPRAAQLFLDHFNKLTLILAVLLAIAAAIYFDLPQLFF